MENKIKISVIIPSYNSSDTIERCIDSVLKQTYQPFEIIIVDDSSTDNTVDKIRKYNNPHIKCISLENNLGAQNARNMGIKAARGEWIAFLDSDDEWIESKLEKQIRILKKNSFNPFIVIHTNAYWLDQNNNEIDIKIPKISFKDSYKDLLKQPGPMFQGILVSKIALQKIGLLDEKVAAFQEWDTSLMLSKYCSFVFIKEKLFKYYFNRAESISQDKKKDIKGYGYIISKYEKDMKKYGFWEKHIIRQIYRNLEIEMWSDVNKYLVRLPSKSPRLIFIMILLSFLRIFHLQPSKVRKMLGERFPRVALMH